MKPRVALIAAILFIVGPALGQTQPASPVPPVAQHAPGVKAPTPAPAEKPVEKLDPAKEAAIRHLMDITETSKMGDNLNAAITGEVRRQMGRAIPPDQLSKFMETFSQRYTPSAPPSAVIDTMIPVYAKHFTMEEIQELVKFYESPLGQRVVKVLPEVVQQSQAAGAQIDQQVAIATLRAMETEYPQLKQMLPPDPSAPAGDATPPSVSPATGTPAPQTTPAPAPKLTPATAPPQH